MSSPSFNQHQQGDGHSSSSTGARPASRSTRGGEPQPPRQPGTRASVPQSETAVSQADGAA